MKKILSVLVFTLFCVGGVFAKSTVKVTVKLSSTSTGMGYVTYSTSTTANETYTRTSGSDENSSWGGILGKWAYSTSPYYIFARTANSEKYYFVGWSKNVDDPSQVDTSIPRNGYQVGGAYAHGENKTVDETYYAHFKEIQTWNIVLAQVVSGGSYTVKHSLNGIETIHPVTTTSGDVIIPAFTDPVSANLTLSATPASNYRFSRWCIDYGNGNVTYDSHPNPSFTLAGSATISCEFINKEYAQFCLKGENNSYFKLSDAIIAAQAPSAVSKVIVVKESGVLYKETESTTYYNLAENTYTIPSSITLLIPGDDAQTVNMDNLTTNDLHYQASGSTFTNKKKLTVSHGQDFDIYGYLCVYAQVHCNMPAMGQPYTYGWLDLGADSHITLQNGARANVFGYITGDPNNSSVHALSGSTVRELLQVMDWRGPEATIDVISQSSKKAFPFNQYYVQNVETKLILESGAVEYVAAGASYTGLDLSGKKTMKVDINAPLTVPDDPQYPSGLFRLGTDAQLIKYYSKDKDRQVYEITKSTSGLVSAILGNIEISLKLAIVGSSNIKSTDYVMPINNNMDIITREGVNLSVSSDFEFLAGSTFLIEENSNVTIAENASCFVYDAQQHHVLNTTGKANALANTYYNYFYGGALKCIKNRPGGVQYDRASKDLVSATGTNPAGTERTTKLLKNNGDITINGKVSGAIYTTGDESSPGGARIISTANGKIAFSSLSNTKKTYQLVQYSDNGTDGVLANPIPLTSAKLLNADGSYSAGAGEEDNGKEYTYYPTWDNGEGKPKGRWASSLLDGNIVDETLQGNTITVKTPKSKPGTITFYPKTGEGLSIKSLSDVAFATDGRFTKNGEATFVDGLVTIPYTYSPTQSHGDNVTETLTLTFACYNIAYSRNEDITMSIELTATQDYQPAFLVNEKADEKITLNFGYVSVHSASAEQTILINPVAGNVTDRTYKDESWYVTWSPTTLPVNSPFEIVSGDYFSGVKVLYKPTTIAGTNPDGYHTQTLTVTAKYSDGVETTKTIVLQGKPLRADNPLQFVEDREIHPNKAIDPLFISTGNKTEITYTYNGEETSNLVEIVESGENYKLQVKSGANIITKQEIIIKASQSYNDITNEGTDEIKVTITPTVQWNWSKLYFGGEYDNAADVIGDAEYQVIYNKDCATIPETNFYESADTDPDKRYSVTVGTGEECTATFNVVHEGVTYTFSSEVYADPRVLNMCMRDENAARTYRDVTIESTNVKYEDGIVFATTESAGAAWTMELIGIPDKMEFVPQGAGKRWTIMEYDGANWSVTYAESEIVLNAGQSYFVHNLKASTQQIRVICSSGAESGKITDLCIYVLDASVSANAETLYMPIVRDENDNITQSQKNVVLSYVNPTSDLWLSVVDGMGNIVPNIVLSGANLIDGKLPKTTIENIYREETIIVSSTHPTEGIVYMLVKDNADSEMLKLPIRLYNYPQPLPVRTAEWKDENAEKYYFYTDLDNSQNVQFNAVTQKLTFTSTGNEQRFVTFAFRGGPSYISFESTIAAVPQENVKVEELVLQEWYDYWTLEVTDGETHRLVANSVEAQVKPEITAEVKDGKTYYQIRIAVPYTTKSLTLQNKRVLPIEVQNVVIDGEPDLDVVLGNHTIEHESEANFSTDIKSRTVEVTAINLPSLKVACNNPNFVVKHGDVSINSTPTELTSVDCPKALGTYLVGNISFDVTWNRTTFDAVDEGLLIFTDKDGQQLATIRLLGTEDYILAGNASSTGIYTGFAENITAHPFSDFFSKSEKYNVERHQVDLTNAFDQNGTALFDYLIVYGETTTTDGSTTVTAPTSANIVNGEATGKGSNAKTPYYIYRKATNTSYQFVFDSENANVSNKAEIENVPHAFIDDDETNYIQIAANEQLKVYVTGFCPYATTGYTKHQEGVWFFRGKPTAQLDLYLEDCHIYSRNKTEIGCNSGKFDFNNPFTEDYARGSGGVFVFECDNEGEYIVPEAEAFRINIHTRGENVLKSNYGSFYEIWGMRAYQVSSPIQVHMASEEHVHNSRSNLTFDDLWPTATQPVRTNGFLSLQKLANNAPSIDLGNPLTEVNFRGGQVELQNAQNVSDKYKTTLAISYRSGIMAAGGVELQMAFGIGTDAATKGTVKFYDGTISVIPMKVKESERKFYLMDPQIDQNGDTIKDANGNPLDSELTSCLRCPQHTFVYGGSIGMIRTCMSPTSKGGAPTDGNKPLGRYIYDGDKLGLTYYNNNGAKPTGEVTAEKWLVKPDQFPTEPSLFQLLVEYYKLYGGYENQTYGLSSVTPDKNGNLTFWIPEGYANVKVENDRYLIPWKACMTQISAELAPEFGGEVGGDVTIESNEDVSNLLYCHLDDYTHAVISEHTGTLQDDNIQYKYKAPVMIPENFSMPGFEIGGQYMYLEPSNVGHKAYEVITPTGGDYKINNKVYYITTALSDTWMNFTMPFDVENIYVVESYPDFKLDNYLKDENVIEKCMVQFPDLDLQKINLEDNPYAATRIFQGKHNADFAAFFGMTMALGSDASFEEMQQDFLDWAYLQDTSEDLPDGERYTGTRKDYDWRGVWPMVHYDGSNFTTSNFYLYVNNGEWKTDEELSAFTTRWEIAPAKDPETNILLHKNQTYSMLFPYCWGCDQDEDRGYWDYWTGKFLIFESTTASEEEPHEIAGKNAALSNFNVSPLESTNARLTGNNSFAQISYGDDERKDMYAYQSAREGGQFVPLTYEEENIETGVPNIVNRIIYPTNTVLLTNFAEPAQVLSVSRDGKIMYRNNGNGGNGDGGVTTGGGNVPTVGGGNDLFITAISGGINVAVAAPQQVRVISSTGAVLFNGYISTAADVILPTKGVYVICGENEVQKIFF